MTTTTDPVELGDAPTVEPLEPVEPVEGRAARRRAAEQQAASTTAAPVPTPTRTERRRARHDDVRAMRLRMLAMSLGILATLCLVLVASVSFLGAMREHRDQTTLYDGFRFDLANGTAPVGQTDSDGVLLTPGTPVAILEIPRLGLRQVVVEGTTSDVLMSGPGHRRDTLLPGQAGVSVIYGRRAAYGGPFAAIASLAKGDVIIATTGQAVSRYTVVDVRRAGQPIPAAATKGRLVLLTADGRPYVPDGVVAVDADLQTDAQPANPRLITNASLTTAEQPLQGQPSAWIMLLLWSQALLLVSLAAAFAWARWGRWEAWLIGLPVVAAVGVATANQAAALLPNLM